MSPGGFGAVTDLSACRSLDDVRDLVAKAYPEEKPQAHTNLAAQLWALVGRMAVDDWVVLPLKTTSQLAVGRIVGDYEYRTDEPDPERRHVRAVRWERTDVRRSAVKQDLLYSLGAFSTYCQISRSAAAARIAAIASTGVDPGSKVVAVSPVKPSTGPRRTPMTPSTPTMCGQTWSSTPSTESPP